MSEKATREEQMCPLNRLDRCIEKRCAWWKSWVAFKGRENEQEMGACAINVLPDIIEDAVQR